MAYTVISYYICNPEITASGTSRCWCTAVMLLCALSEKTCDDAGGTVWKPKDRDARALTSLLGSLLTAEIF